VNLSTHLKIRQDDAARIVQLLAQHDAESFAH
jgi:hypothetical protein